jgi:peptidoglycan DL-endopeptidase CwlO
VFSAVAAAAIAALFQPVPAMADPAAAQQDTFNLAVPDSGSRPAALGSLTLPGQKAPTVTPTSSLTGVALTPVLQQVEKGRNEITKLGDQLIQLEQDRKLAREQEAAAKLKFDQAAANLLQARAAAADAAAQSVIDAAGMPPGGIGGLSDLGDLARVQRGDGTAQAIARQIEQAQINSQLALDEHALSAERNADLSVKYTKLDTQLKQKQAAQQRLEAAHAPEIRAAEASQAGVDSALGASYLAGSEAGRGADARAIGALNFALAQRGDPYVWSEEGPDQYDCSGLMWAAYRSVGFQLNRVSRDQYRQTSDRVVSRYSLLPGDLLFFSHSNSWQDIHHVAMYAGDGMMVEAPRTGLSVRLVPVRWSRLFQATRVFGSIEGVVQGPELGAPDPEPPTTPDNPRPSTTPTKTPTTPPTSKPPSSPPPTSKPPTSPSTPPSSSTPPPSSSNPPSSSTPPPSSSNPPSSSSPTPTTNPPDPDPTTTKPETTSAPPNSPSEDDSSDSSPSNGTTSSRASSDDSSPSGGSSSSSSSSKPTSSTSSAKSSESSPESSASSSGS